MLVYANLRIFLQSDALRFFLPRNRAVARGQSGLLYIAELAELVLTVTPVGFNLDEEFEVDAFAEECLDILAGLATDTLERCALMADDDAFLRLAFHIDYGHDVD